MTNGEKIILDLCAGTGAWSEPYLEAGYDVRRITLPEHDVRDYKPPKRVYGILMAVDCTHMSGSGAQYWHVKDLDGRTLQAVLLIKVCLEIKDYCKPLFWSLENPVGRINKLVPELGEPRLRFNPCDYGDPYTKKTCLWGDFNIPEKHPVAPVFYQTSTGKRGSWQFAKLGGKSERTKTLRSITPTGFARAFYEANK